MEKHGFDSGYGNRTHALYDSVSKKIVVAYCNYNENNYRSGNITLGTVKEDNIEFNEPKVFSKNSILCPSLAYDSYNKKVILVYRHAFRKVGSIKLGTITDNDIMFSDDVVFSNKYPCCISALYSKTNKKLIIAYAEQGSNPCGIISLCNIYDKDINLEKPIVFHSGIVYSTSIAYDSDNNKIIIAYRDLKKRRGMIKVGTLTNNDIKFGHEVMLYNSDIYYTSMVYDTKNKKVIIAFTDSINSGKGMIRIGTVNGNSIMLTDPVIFNEHVTRYISALYHQVNNKVFIAYHNSDISNIEYYSREDTKSLYYENTDGRYTRVTDKVSGCIIAGTVTENDISFEKPVTFSDTNVHAVSLNYDYDNNKAIVVYHDGNYGYGTAKVV